ncbi:MAG: alpha/beta fold hydrolase [Pseudomonadota bacterium]
MLETQPWILRQPGPGRRLRLFCFSYAGGNAASYLPWQAELDPAIEVCALQLPGRGARMGETPYSCLASLVAALAPVIASRNALPFAFFGHSLGALVAFEVARHLQRHGMPMPEHLFVSGCEAPQYRSPPKNLHALPEAELIESLRSYNGTPSEVLAHRELMELLLPTIRADFSLVDNYHYDPAPLLTIPVTVLAGRGDDHVATGLVEQWQRETEAACEIEWFDGDHFFIHSERRAVLRCVAAGLAAGQYA